MPRLVQLVLLLSGALALAAHGAERVGDGLTWYALQDRTHAADAIQAELLALIENSPEQDRFDLYRTYHQLTGAWIQIRLSQTLIEQAMAATSRSEEEKIRATLRDQGQFALWELDEAIAYLDRNALTSNRRESLRVNAAIRSLLYETAPIVGRLLAEQCSYVPC